MTKHTRRQNRTLLKEVRALQKVGAADVTRALKALAAEAAPDPSSFPTRQQRRRAERQARKKGAK